MFKTKISKKFVRTLILSFFCVSPVFFFTDIASNFTAINPDVSFQQFKLFVIFCGLLLFCTQEKLFSFRNLFFLLCIISSIISGTDSILILVPYVFAYLCFSLCRKGFSVSPKKLGLIFASVLSINLVFCALQYCKIDIFFQQSNLQPAGLFLLPCYLGQYSVIVAPVIVYFCPWLIVIPFACVLLSKSVFCVIAFFVTIFLYAFFMIKRARKILIAIACLCLVGGVLYASFDRISGQWGRRGHVWAMVMSKAMRSPFWGRGIGSYDKTMWLEFAGDTGTDWASVSIREDNRQEFAQLIIDKCTKYGTDWSRIVSIHFKEPGAPFANFKDITDDLRGKDTNRLQIYSWNQPHNEYLRIFYELGALGLFLFFGFVYDLCRRFMSRFANINDLIPLFCSFIGLLIVGIVHFPFYLPCIAPTSIILLAMLERRLERGAI